MSPPVCAICSQPLAQASPCWDAHPDHCHDYTRLNLSQGFDAREHRPPTPSALPMREVAAVAAYTRHVQAITGTGPLVDLVTEEEA